MPLNRRHFLGTLGALPLAGLFDDAHADGHARRILFLYFPDGVPSWSQNGDASVWHPTGSEVDFQLTHCLEPIGEYRDRCVFINGLSMGGTDSGSHPGGAKKLLTAMDHGNGRSIDQHLAHTVGASSPWRHLYLGVQATSDGASGDKYISYPSAQTTLAPEDDPYRAFESLFGSWDGSSGGSSDPQDPVLDPDVLDAMAADLSAYRGELNGVEKDKLDYHTESLKELQARVSGPGDGGTGSGSCDDPGLNTSGIGDLNDPASFPGIARAQIDTTILAMECGLTRVGTIQMSHHTSELVMSRFPDTEMHDPNYDMRSHQASHYGASHDWNSREFTAFVQQRRWFVSQFRYALEQLAARPEGSGSMLDHTLVVLCTEVCDGNIHDHDNMPFVVAGAVNGGRLIDTWGRRHGDLWAGLATMMGESLNSFGVGSDGPLTL